MVPRWSTAIVSALWLILITATWAVFAPTQAGGQASFIVVAGKSMEPAFHFGDLVLVHRESNYAIGDVVAYRNLDLGNNVFHRIIGQDHDRFILKGDNNSWIDSYQPGPEDLIGVFWLQLPRAGFWVQQIRRPANMALIAGLLAAGLSLSMVDERSKGSRKMNRLSLREKLKGFPLSKLFKTDGRPAPGSNKPARPPMDTGPIVETAFFVLGSIAFAALILGFFSFTRPASRQIPVDVAYQHLGFFSYSAPAPAGIYDASGLITGAPVFPKVTCSIDLRFQYTLVGDQPQDIVGSYSLSARVMDPQSGWQRSMILKPETPFSGVTFDTHSPVNFCEIQGLINDMEQQTDFHPVSYTLYLVPKVELIGTLSAHLLEGSFEPHLAFRYDRANFYILQEDPEINPFSPTQADLIRDFREAANTISLFGLELNVPSLRLAALIGLVLSLGGMAGFGVSLQHMVDKKPESFIRTKYGSILADIQNRGAIDPAHLIEVASIEDLAKLAERHNATILHEVRGPAYHYYVDVGQVTYQYVLGGGDGQEEQQ